MKWKIVVALVLSCKVGAVQTQSQPGPSPTATAAPSPHATPATLVLQSAPVAPAAPRVYSIAPCAVWVPIIVALLLPVFARLYEWMQRKKLDASKRSQFITNPYGKTSEQFQDAMNQVIDRHRHEDNMLNNRLQAFLVTTAFLVGGFAQFREPQFWPLRIVVATFGTWFAAIMLAVLARTAARIGEYKIYIGEIEQASITNESLRPFSLFPSYPCVERTSDVLGIWIPRGVICLWAALLFASVASDFVAKHK